MGRECSVWALITAFAGLLRTEQGMAARRVLRLERDDCAQGGVEGRREPHVRRADVEGRTAQPGASSVSPSGLLVSPALLLPLSSGLPSFPVSQTSI